MVGQANGNICDGVILAEIKLEGNFRNSTDEKEFVYYIRLDNTDFLSVMCHMLHPSIKISRPDVCDKFGLRRASQCSYRVILRIPVEIRIVY